MKKLLLPAALLCLTITACMKFDTYPVAPTANGCKIASMFLYNGGSTPSDTARFTWNGNNITKVVQNNEHYDIEYNGALVTKRSFFQGSATAPYRYDQFIYNPAANYLMTRYELFEEDTPGNFYRSDSTVFQFANGFLTGFTQYVRPAPGAPMELTMQNQFTYAASDLWQVRSIDFAGGTAVDTTNSSISVYQEPNHFSAINDRFWMVNPLLVKSDMNAIEQSLTRNALAQVVTNGVPFIATYVTDEKGNLSEYRELGVLMAKFAYNCP